MKWITLGTEEPARQPGRLLREPISFDDAQKTERPWGQAITTGLVFVAAATFSYLTHLKKNR